jgi:uncharacterized protein (TIGR03437 family)
MSGQRHSSALLGMVLLTAACSSSDDVPAPLVASVAPARAPGGALVTISGNHFCQTPDTGNEDPTCLSAGTVEFGLSPGAASTWSDVTITAEVPSLPPGPLTVRVVAAGRTSNGVTFTVE